MLSTNSSLGLGRVKKNDFVDASRIRREGGGRMSFTRKFPDINEAFLSIIEPHVAGDPMNEKIKWVKLSRAEIREGMKKRGISINRNAIKKLLKKNGFVKRKIQRKKSTGEFKDRNKQFNNIEKLKTKFFHSKNPILSIDTKKKEKIGNLHRNGQVYCTQAIESYDHDYAHLSEMTVIPHGVYDMKRNEAFMNIGTGKETAEFVCDSVKKWWEHQGKSHYPDAKEILLLCDAGGANCYRHHVFKLALQNLANSIGLPIRISHYPPYSSKWNPIEHKVFPHVSRAMEGVKLESIESVKELIKKAKTKAGLKVFAQITRKVYKKKIFPIKSAIKKINIIKHGSLSQLNYTILPAVSKC